MCSALHIYFKIRIYIEKQTNDTNYKLTQKIYKACNIFPQYFFCLLFLTCSVYSCSLKVACRVTYLSLTVI